MKKLVSKPNNGLVGTIEIPSDKSISHRAVIFSSLAKGKSTIKNFSKGQDSLSSLRICNSLGLNYNFENNDLVITSTGKLKPPKTELDCGNSGTTMRLMAGILAGQTFDTILYGDDSLSKRPMKRIIEPLKLMGAKIESNNYMAPLKIEGAPLSGINYSCELSSAQIKSCILLAGLNAEGKTVYTEPYISRNHTEIMLQHMEANINNDGAKTTIEQSNLSPKIIEIPGDISSAAFFIAAGLIVPDSKIILKNVGLNPTRTGFIDVVKAMGGKIKILEQKKISGEEVGDLEVLYSNLNSTTIGGSLIPRLIDEIPLIAVLATQTEGITIIKDASDLRNKESDRITTTVNQLKKLGACIEETVDGMIIHGKTELKGDVEVISCGDHRLAMSLYIAGLVSQKNIIIDGFEWVDISFPEFEKLFYKLL